MANMSYCRMENTASALGDCVNHWNDELTTDDEMRGKQQIIALAREIMDLEGIEFGDGAGNEDEDYVDDDIEDDSK